MIRFCFVFLCFCCNPASVSGQTLNWVWLNFPPAFILDEPLKDKGIIKRWLPQLQVDALTDMTHQFQPMTPARAWQSMKGGELLCHPAALFDEARAEYAAFSQPWSLVPNKAVLLRKADAERWFPGRQSVSAAELFARKDLRLGLLQDHHYYVQVEDWLDSSYAEKNAVRLSNKQPVSALYRLLVNQRIDYMLEYPWIGGYLKRVMAMKGQRQPVEIVSLMITELPQFAPAYVACTNSPAGREIIKRINSWLVANRSNAIFRDYVGVWLDSESRKRFQQAYGNKIAPITVQ